MIFINGCTGLHFFFYGLRGGAGGDIKKHFSDLQSFGLLDKYSILQSTLVFVKQVRVS